jgi:hypothetical protein
MRGASKVHDGVRAIERGAPIAPSFTAGDAHDHAADAQRIA